MILSRYNVFFYIHKHVRQLAVIEFSLPWNEERTSILLEKCWLELKLKVKVEIAFIENNFNLNALLLFSLFLFPIHKTFEWVPLFAQSTGCLLYSNQTLFYYFIYKSPDIKPSPQIMSSLKSHKPAPNDLSSVIAFVCYFCAGFPNYTTISYLDKIRDLFKVKLHTIRS